MHRLCHRWEGGTSHSTSDRLRSANLKTRSRCVCCAARLHTACLSPIGSADLLHWCHASQLRPTSRASVMQKWFPVSFSMRPSRYPVSHPMAWRLLTSISSVMLRVMALCIALPGQLAASRSIGEIPSSILVPSDPDLMHSIRELACKAFKDGSSSALAGAALPSMTAAARTDFDCPSNPYYRCYVWLLFIGYIEDALVADFCVKTMSTDHSVFRQYLALLRSVTPTYDSINVCFFFIHCSLSCVFLWPTLLGGDNVRL